MSPRESSTLDVAPSILRVVFALRPSALLVLAALGGCSGGRAPRAAAPPGGVALEPATNRLEIERPPPAAADAAPALIATLRSELGRSLEQLRLQKALVPYYLAYEVSDVREIAVSAELGALTETADEHYRLLDVALRVGSPSLDNTHGSYQSGYFEGTRPFPLEDDELAVRSTLWLATDERYDRATEELVRVTAERQVNVREEDESDDFSKQPRVTYFEPPVTLTADLPALQARVKRLSALFRGRPGLERSYVRLVLTAENRYFVSSEGTELVLPRRHARLSFGAFTTAADGDKLSREINFDAHDPAALAGDDVVEPRIARALDELSALQRAPLGSPYLGPAILDGPAAAVFFHEILGHRVEGHRQKSEFEGQTFAKKLGEPVMPRGFDVYDDPRIQRVNGADLNGFYRFDGEGVPAERATVIEDGVLRGFLMSRSPIAGFARSNGHGRREPGYRAVARQANLIVEPARVTTLPSLKRALLAEVKRQNKPYGLRIGEVTGGYTMTERGNPQAFQIAPVMVYRVYPDGREELVRGVTLEGMPLSVLARVLAAGDDFYVFNGYCGAESGEVPASAVSPSLLVAQIELARQQKSSERPPLLPPPPQTGSAR